MVSAMGSWPRCLNRHGLWTWVKRGEMRKPEVERGDKREGRVTEMGRGYDRRTASRVINNRVQLPLSSFSSFPLSILFSLPLDCPSLYLACSLSHWFSIRLVLYQVCSLFCWLPHPLIRCFRDSTPVQDSPKKSHAAWFLKRCPSVDTGSPWFTTGFRQPTWKWEILGC